MLPYFAVIVVATHVLAFCSWHLIEKPAMSLKDWSPGRCSPRCAARRQPSRRQPRPDRDPEPTRPSARRPWPVPAVDALRRTDARDPLTRATPATADDAGIAQRPRLVSRLRLVPLGVLCLRRGPRRCSRRRPRRHGHRGHPRVRPPEVARTAAEKAAERAAKAKDRVHAEVQHGRRRASRGGASRKRASEKAFRGAIEKENRGYVKGKDGWKFFTDYQANNFSQALGRVTQTSQAAEAWAKWITKQQKLVEKAGGATTSWSRPANWDIYPQKLPTLGPAAARHHLAAAADESAPRAALDRHPARRCTRPRRSTTPTSRSNSHWTPYGGYVAWQAITKCLGPPTRAPRPGSPRPRSPVSASAPTSTSSRRNGVPDGQAARAPTRSTQPHPADRRSPRAGRRPGRHQSRLRRPTPCRRRSRPRRRRPRRPDAHDADAARLDRQRAVAAVAATPSAPPSSTTTASPSSAASRRTCPQLMAHAPPATWSCSSSPSGSWPSRRRSEGRRSTQLKAASASSPAARASSDAPCPPSWPTTSTGSSPSTTCTRRCTPTARAPGGARRRASSWCVGDVTVAGDWDALLGRGPSRRRSSTWPPRPAPPSRSPRRPGTRWSTWSARPRCSTPSSATTPCPSGCVLTSSRAVYGEGAWADARVGSSTPASARAAMLRGGPVGLPGPDGDAVRVQPRPGRLRPASTAPRSSRRSTS